jgi:hypothetical protein
MILLNSQSSRILTDTRPKIIVALPFLNFQIGLGYLFGDSIAGTFPVPTLK